MAGNEVRIPILVTGAPAAARDLDKVGDSADGAGDDLKGMAADAAILDKAIEDLNGTLAKTRAELAQSPDDPALWKQTRKGERDLRKYTKLREAVFGSPAEVISAGTETGKLLGTGIADALGALPAQLKGAGIAIGSALALAAAPFLGSVIGAAVIGGVGVGGIIGGIAAAAQDQQVKSAGERLGESLKAGFAGIGEPFVEPLIEQMGRLEGIGSDFFGGLRDDIAPLADHLDNLVDGIGGFAKNLDLSAAVEAAGPLIDVIGDELPEVAESLTDALNSISEESDGLAVGLRNLFDVMESGIETTGAVVGFLASTEEGIVDLGSAVGDLSDAYLDSSAMVVWPWLIPLAEGLSGVGKKTDEYLNRVIRARGASGDLGDGLDGITRTARATSKEVEGLSDAFDALFGKQMSLDEANAAYKQGIRDLREELTDGRRTLDENTQAGLDNAGAVRDQIGVIEDLRQAQFAQTGNLQEANATYDKHIAQLRTTLANLGYNKDEIEKLVGAYQRLPKDGVDIAFRSPGLWTALQRVRELSRLLGSNAAGRNAAEGSEPISGRASGGPVLAGRPYVVGEEGPELVTFGANGMVHNATQTKAMLSGSSGGAMPALPPIQLVLSGNTDPVIRALFEAFQGLIYAQWGGNVNDGLGWTGARL